MVQRWPLIFILSVSLLSIAPLSLAQALLLSPEEHAYVLAHPVIRASNEMDYPPLDFVIDGQPNGYSIDLLNLLSSKNRFSDTVCQWLYLGTARCVVQARSVGFAAFSGQDTRTGAVWPLFHALSTHPHPLCHPDGYAQL